MNIIQRLEAILPHMRSGMISYAKAELQKVIRELHMQPHPERNSYFAVEERGETECTSYKNT